MTPDHSAQPKSVPDEGNSSVPAEGVEALRLVDDFEDALIAKMRSADPDDTYRGTRPVRDYVAARDALLRTLAASRGEAVAWVNPEMLAAWQACPGANRLHPQSVRTAFYSTPLYTTPTADSFAGERSVERDARVRELVEQAFAAGWVHAAQWADREDLVHDIGSDAYTKDRDAALAAMDQQ